MIKLYDRNRTYITDIDNHVRVGYEKDFRATWSASLELLANDPVNIMIQPFFMIDIWDDYGEYIGKYRILPKSASVSGNSSIISYNCHHVLHTLLDSTIRKKRYFENTDLPTAIKDVLKWQVEKHWVTGNVSSLTKVQGMEMGVQTGLLSPLLELIGHSSVGEYYTYNTLTYPWVLNVAKVTPLNCRIKEGYNMSSFEIETDPTGIVNRVYGYGAIPEESTEDDPLPPITVANINNGLEYVEDADSIAKYGVKEYVFTDERYESDISLLEAMKYILKSLSAEVVRVRCTAHDIIKASDNPISIDEIRMGRTVFFDTEDFGAFEMTITKEGKSDIFGDPTTMEIELSLDYSSMPVTGISRDIQIIKKEIIATQNAVRIAADGKTVVETGPNEPVNPKVGTLWYKQVTDLETGLTAYKMHVWNGETWRVIDDDIDRALEDLAASKVLIDTVKTQAGQLAIDLENGLSMALTEDGILDAINAKANRIIFVAGGDGTHHVLQLTSDGVFIDKGLIQEAHIANGSITDAKIGDLTFGWAVGQTIDAQLIRVVNLDANSVTSGKFSGERLEIGSITREHIADGILDEYTTLQQWNEFLVSYDTFKSEITQTVTDKVGNLEQTLNSKIQQQIGAVRLSVSAEIKSETKTINTKIATLELKDAELTARFENIGGTNLIKDSMVLTGWKPYDGNTITETYNQMVSQWDTTSAVGVKTNQGDKTTNLKAFKLMGTFDSSMVGKTITFSIYVRNNREYPMSVGLNCLDEKATVPANTTRRVSVTGKIKAGYSTYVIWLHSYGITYYLDCTVYKALIDVGTKLNEWTQHPDEHSSGSTKIDEEGITVGKFGEEVETRIKNDGLRVYDTISETAILEATRDGGKFDVIYANNIISDTIVKNINRNFDIYVQGNATGDGSGRDTNNRADSISEALEHTLGGAKYLNEGVTINVHVYGTINEIAFIAGFIGQGDINIFGYSGATITGRMILSSCTVHVKISDLTFVLDPAESALDNACILGHKMSRMIVEGCIFDGPAVGNGYGIITTGGTNLSLFGSTFYDFKYCVHADTLSNVTIHNIRGSDVNALGNAAGGSRLISTGYRPVQTYNNVLQNNNAWTLGGTGEAIAGRRPTTSPPTFKTVSKTFYARNIGTRNNGSSYVWNTSEWRQGTWSGDGYHVIGFCEFGSAIKDWLASGGGYSGTVTMRIEATRTGSGYGPVGMMIASPGATNTPAVARFAKTSANLSSGIVTNAISATNFRLQSSTSAVSNYAGFKDIKITVTTQKKI